MDRAQLERLLGREPDATDQPPGYYRFRNTRGAPLQALRLLWTEDGMWHCLVNGRAVYLSCQDDPQKIPTIRDRGPFHAISQREYYRLLAQYQNARAGTPLTHPKDPVDLKDCPPR